ncbi:MAG: alpha-hydroxy-acid oxidizing protein [Lachnospiraceae bacterium]|nr:alpha-hydroxy-acid oxidizing protein [Lachnospiraceae bacterium]
MTWQEVLENARGNVGPYCKACNICNGKACGRTIPGPGSKGVGDTAIRNYEAWQAVRVNMDTITDHFTPDTSFSFFGYEMKYPIFAGPVGAVKLHYGDKLDDVEYNNLLVAGCREAGIAALTGDGTNPTVMAAACKAIAEAGGCGVPTIKPWDSETLEIKYDLVNASNAIAAAMDIDAAGLPFLQNLTPPAGPKTVEELAQIVKKAGRPFIVKGIMTVKGALKAKEAGAAGIVVSNHGGRVQDQCPATAEVLPEIADAVGKEMMILVDGGIRTGVDIFKALAMGADAVIIARPYVTSVYGGGKEGIKALTEKLGGELRDTMKMCGVKNLGEITEDNIFYGML